HAALAVHELHRVLVSPLLASAGVAAVVTDVVGVEAAHADRVGAVGVLLDLAPGGATRGAHAVLGGLGQGGVAVVAGDRANVLVEGIARRLGGGIEAVLQRVLAALAGHHGAVLVPVAVRQPGARRGRRIGAVVAVLVAQGVEAGLRSKAGPGAAGREPLVGAVALDRLGGGIGVADGL